MLSGLTWVGQNSLGYFSVSLRDVKASARFRYSRIIPSFVSLLHYRTFPGTQEWEQEMGKS